MSFDSLRRARARKCALRAALALAAVPAFAGTAVAQTGGLDIPGNTIWTGDYETGGTSQWSGCQRAATYSIQVGSGRVRQGSYAARYEVRDGDTPIDSNERSECQKGTGEVEGSDRWYSWSTYFDDGFPTSNASPNGWFTFSQWHGNASTGSPPVALYLENGQIVLKLHRQSSPASYVGIITPWGTPFAGHAGRWTDFKMHIKWSASDSVGTVELWMDGVKQTMNWPQGGNAAAYGGVGSSIVRSRTLIPGYGAYYKQGIYRDGGTSGTAVVYQDAFRITDGAGGVQEPTPPPPPSATITVTPGTASVAAGATQQFTAAGGTVTWSVNGVAGGNSTVGTVSAAGLYTAPATVPSGGKVTVTATSTASSTIKASATVTVTAPATGPAPAPAPAPAPGTSPLPAPTNLAFSDSFEGVAPGISGSPWQLYRDSSNAVSITTSPVASGAQALNVAYTGSGNYVYAGRGFAARNSAAVTAKVFVRDQTLANGHTRVLLRVLDGPGAALNTPRFEVGLRRTSSGDLRWAVWSMNASRTFSPAALSAGAPQAGRWYTLRLSSDWNSATSRARLVVSDGTDISTPAVNFSGYQADRLEIGTPWADSGDAARIVWDDVQVGDGGASSVARARRATVRRWARVVIPPYRTTPRPTRPRQRTHR